jgi:hypothetical protein
MKMTAFISITNGNGNIISITGISNCHTGNELRIGYVGTTIAKHISALASAPPCNNPMKYRMYEMTIINGMMKSLRYRRSSPNI